MLPYQDVKRKSQWMKKKNMNAPIAIKWNDLKNS
jgi:hypothetical protein